MEAMASDCHGGRQRNPKGVVHRPSGSRDVGAHAIRCGQVVVGKCGLRVLSLHWLGNCWMEPIPALVCSCMPWEVQIACISLPSCGQALSTVTNGFPLRSVLSPLQPRGCQGWTSPLTPGGLGPDTATSRRYLRNGPILRRFRPRDLSHLSRSAISRRSVEFHRIS